MENKLNLLQRVSSTLETLRPYLNADGGDIELVDINEDFVVSVRLLGTCQSCEISGMTMKAGVENGIMKAVPEIRSVIAVED